MSEKGVSGSYGVKVQGGARTYDAECSNEHGRRSLIQRYHFGDEVGGHADYRD